MSTAHDIASALAGRLSAIHGLPPVAWPNTSFDPGESSWVRPTNLPAPAEALTIGGGSVLVRYTGVYQVDCFTPSGSGSDDALILADLIAGAFLPGVALIATSATVLIRAAWVERAIDSPPWYQVPVRISWEAHATLARS